MRLLALAAPAAVVVATPAAAAAERDACRPDATFRGAAIDVDVRAADLHDVFRLLADAGRVNVVVSDEVRGVITLRLRRVAWDLALCTVARARRLRVTVDGNVYLVRPGPAS